MSLPFTREQFFEVFSRYNEAVMPFQLALFLLGLSAFFALVVRRPGSDRVVSAILATQWAWMGVVYHWLYFSALNPAAWLFGGAFLLGAAAFLWAGVARSQLVFDNQSRARRLAGHLLIGYALVGYPLASVLLGREYPEIVTFGLPCPTAIFTIGMLAFVSQPFARYVLVVPVAWALIGGQAAFLLGVLEDIGLLFAGLVGIWLALDSRAQHVPA